MWIWEGDGVGGFELIRTFNVFPYPEMIEIADVNADDIVDIGMVGAGAIVFFVLGEGAGQFSPPIGFGIAGIASDFALEDLDGDSNLDVVVTQSNTYYDASRLITLFGDPSLYP